jgi:hypothetical protein
VDRDGKLTVKEFALAKWLLRMGENQPDVLPRELMF